MTNEEKQKLLLELAVQHIRVIYSEENFHYDSTLYEEEKVECIEYIEGEVTADEIAFEEDNGFVDYIEGYSGVHVEKVRENEFLYDKKIAYDEVAEYIEEDFDDDFDDTILERIEDVERNRILDKRADMIIENLLNGKLMVTVYDSDEPFLFEEHFKKGIFQEISSIIDKINSENKMVYHIYFYSETYYFYIASFQEINGELFTEKVKKQSCSEINFLYNLFPIREYCTCIPVYTYYCDEHDVQEYRKIFIKIDEETFGKRCYSCRVDI